MLNFLPVLHRFWHSNSTGKIWHRLRIYSESGQYSLCSGIFFQDSTGLGRWTVMTLQGDEVWTRIVCGYNPCGNGKLNSGTSYQQHCWYFITHKKDLLWPRKQLCEELIKQLEEWRQDRDRLIVCLDTNKDIHKKTDWKGTHKWQVTQHVQGGWWLYWKTHWSDLLPWIQTNWRSLGHAVHCNNPFVCYAGGLWHRRSPDVCY